MKAKLAAAALAAVCLASCAPAPLGTTGADTQQPGPASSSAAPAASPTPTIDACAQMAEGLTPDQQVGQLFMVGIDSEELSETTRQVIADSEIGSVVLLCNRSSGHSAVRKLTAAISSEGTAELPILVAVDQEGGTVQRLQGSGFSDLPSARDQGSWTPAELRSEAKIWGKELKSAGVDYNLAPVGDVVPEAKRSSNAPIGALQRDFGSDPEAVAASTSAFIEGMSSAGVLTSIKHFPGLGEVDENTDYAAAHDDVTDADSDSLLPFRAAIAESVDSVMVSSAIFDRIDPDHQGVFSSAIIDELLRGELGYDGVVIADDLGAAQAVGDVAPGQRAVNFLAAGGDLVINADPSIMADMVDAVAAWSDEDPANAALVLDSTVRILRLKERAGLMECGA